MGLLIKDYLEDGLPGIVSIWKGNNPILRGLRITMVINYLPPSWDDPPRLLSVRNHQLRPGESPIFRVDFSLSTNYVIS